MQKACWPAEHSIIFTITYRAGFKMEHILNLIDLIIPYKLFLKSIAEKNLFVYDWIMRICYFCKQPLDDAVKVFRSTLCPSCSKDLKICHNCKFYSKDSHWDCLETINELVREKDRSNFCDFFVFKKADPHKLSEPSETREDKARENFNMLFDDEQ